MKTASFSHARKLTVITKKKCKKIAAACWDIDEIEEKNETLAEKKINEMCKKLLVNLIIEDYKIQKI